MYGGYLFNETDANVDFDDSDDKLGGLNSLSPGKDGHQIGGAIGVPLSERMDFRVALTSESFVDDDDSIEDFSKVGSFAEADSHFALRYLDLELGYRPGMVETGYLRLFAGARVLNAFNSIDYNTYDPGITDKIGNYEAETETWGVGPRIGAEGGFQFGNSGVSLFLMGAGSAVFSHVDQSYSATVNGVSTSSDDSDSRTIYSLEGKVALGYDVTRSINFQFGYQAQQWWNLVQTFENVGSDEPFDFDGTDDFLTHGPFARITVKLP